MLNEKIDDDLRRHVLLALEYGGDPSALPFFISAYEDKDFHDDWMKVELGEAICNLAGPDELDRVVSLLHVKENRTARAAAKALARIKTKPAIDALFAYVKVDGSPVRAEVVELIAGLDDPRSVPEVISAASDHDKTVRLFAVNGMGDRANALFVAPLMSALDDKDVNVRSQAIPALVKQKIDRRELFKTVLSKLDDKEPNVQSAASSALAGITGRHFGTDKKKWTDWYEAFGDEFKWDE
jgi:HEAT repeat protein